MSITFKDEDLDEINLMISAKGNLVVTNTDHLQEVSVILNWDQVNEMIDWILDAKTRRNQRQILREQALEKLSPEEREVLGV